MSTFNLSKVFPELPANQCSNDINPWCETSMGHQVVEIIYLSCISILGIFGNLLLILSVVYEKRTYKYGNIFIISLAFADFLITGIYTPTVIGNVVVLGNVLPVRACYAFGYMIMTSCICSMWNLSLIAFNRYLAVTRYTTYKVLFTKRRSHTMLAMLWIYSLLLPFPAAIGWTHLTYDAKAMVCAWDNVASLSFSIYLMFGAILIPLAITVFCYWQMLWFVRTHIKRFKKARKNNDNRPSSSSQASTRRWMQKEISLSKALATAVLCFVLCWSPYLICILVDDGNIYPWIKKISSWLGLTNSAANFIIYGFMNREFQRGYKNFLRFLCCCKTRKKKVPPRPTLPQPGFRTSKMLPVVNREKIYRQHDKNGEPRAAIR